MAEIKCYTVTVGEFKPGIFGRLPKAQWKALEYIVNTNGFMGVYPVTGKGTLLIYRTENNAKVARNELIARGCPCGDNIVEVFVDEEHLPEGQVGHWSSRPTATVRRRRPSPKGSSG